VNVIDYSLISKALEYYKDIGYQYIEAPWIVDYKSISITLPVERLSQTLFDGYVIGSAEQSFIYLYKENKLKPGKYVAASPCFRDEAEDEWHSKTFFKVELIIIHDHPSSEYEVKSLVSDATVFFDFHSKKYHKNISLIKTNEGYDLNLNGIEVGSYGSRSVKIKNKKFYWSYGTGLAEPRFSMACQHK
jgi:hypothetical protein